MHPSLFRSASELLVHYARHHRDQRNIATHLIGVPMIVFGLAVLLARATVWPGDPGLSLSWAIWGLATLWYVSRGHLLIGLTVSLFNAALVALAHLPAGSSISQWLSWGLGCFAAGWTLQWLGHYYEGRKPALVEDLSGLLVGPMFVSAELLFSMGLAEPMRREIEGRAGPTVLRDLAHPVG